jgi:hypothetical protein
VEKQRLGRADALLAPEKANFETAVGEKSPTEICYKRPFQADRRRLPANSHRKLLRTRLILRTPENEPVRGSERFKR